MPFHPAYRTWWDLRTLGNIQIFQYVAAMVRARAHSRHTVVYPLHPFGSRFCMPCGEYVKTPPPLDLKGEVGKVTDEGTGSLSYVAHCMELIRFELAGRFFSVDTDLVLGLVTLGPHVLHVPDSVTFNNEEVPVYRLDRLLNIKDEERYPFPPREILVLRGAKGPFGIAVDWVGEIYRVSTSRALFRFPQSTASQIEMFGIWGVTTIEGTATLIVEPEALIVNERHRTETLPPHPTGDHPIRTHQL